MNTSALRTFALTGITVLFSISITFAQQGMGVGTNNPLEMLHVTGAIKVGTDINNSSAAPSGGAGTIRFKAGQFEGWDGTTWTPLGGGTDNQNLTAATITGTTLQISIENGSSASVNLSSLVNDADASATNELQTLSLSGNTLAISSGNNVSLAGFVNTDNQNLSSTTSGTNRTINISGGTGTTISVADNDNSSSNELQTLSQSGTNVTLSNGGGTISVADNDNSSSNEIQTLSLSGNTLAISSGNNVNLAGFVNTDNQNLSSTTSGTNRTINISGGTGTTISVADNDNSSSNELQTLSQSGTNVTLSNGGGTISVADNDNSTSNELQTLSISGNSITLSNGGGTVSVPNDGDWTVSGNNQYSSVSGNVGIGDNTPDAKLDVEGDVHINGYGIKFTDTENANATIELRASDPAYPDEGVTLRTLTNPPSGEPIFRVLSSGGAERLRVEHAGAVSIDNTLRVQGGSPASGKVLTATDNLGNAVWSSGIALVDADGDTKVQVEESADEDMIRFDLAGTERFRMAGSVLEVLSSNQSVYIGESAGSSIDPTSARNTAIGFQALKNATISTWNTAIGSGAMATVTDGSGSNVAIGARSMSGAQNVNSSIAIGTEALLNVNNVSNNIAIGWLSQKARTSGSRNITLGSEALKNATQGSDNVVIGYQAGYNADGSGCVFIGHKAGFFEDSDNKFFIDNDDTNHPLIYGEFDNDIVGINGKLGVNTESPAFQLDVEAGVSGNTGFVARVYNTATNATNSTRYNGLRIDAGKDANNSANSRMIAFFRPDGTEIGSVVQNNTNSVSFNTTSDIRLKTNITETAKGLQDLMQIEVKDYMYKDDAEQAPQTGFIAQQLYEHFPLAVTPGSENAETDPWMVDYGKLTPLLVKAVQDLKAEKDAEIEALQALVQELLGRLQELEQP